MIDNMEERGAMMAFHGLIISIILYVIMVFLLKQQPIVAENRSIIMGALVVIYMILFGHGLPGPINKNI
jgi:TRAP-type C4-dicarboxylate transport system permease small subunit